MTLGDPTGHLWITNIMWEVSSLHSTKREGSEPQEIGGSPYTGKLSVRWEREVTESYERNARQTTRAGFR